MVKEFFGGGKKMTGNPRGVVPGTFGDSNSFLGLQGQYFDNSKERRRIIIALAIAVIFHAVLILLHFTRAGRAANLVPEHQLIAVELQPLKSSGGPRGGDSRPRSMPPTPQTTNLPRPSPKVPRVIPMPKPIEVTPIIEDTPSLDTRHQKTSDLNIGDISGPPGPGGLGTNNGSGRGGGVGNDTGSGSDRGGVAGRDGYGHPEIQFRPRPDYTEEGRINKITGVVVVRALFTADGKVASPKVIRGLGYGLDEKAIQAVLRIKFKPAIKDGKSASVWLTIEVRFQLL